MSTNYYLRYNICECCNRFDEIHIGKSSYKWRFLFRGYDDFSPVLQTYDQWFEFIGDQLYRDTAEIVNEYGKIVQFGDFVEMVEDKQKDPENKIHNFDNNYVDVRGYNFSNREFS